MGRVSGDTSATVVVGGLLVWLAGDERGESGDGAQRSSVRVDPLPLVVHTRAVVAAASSLRAQPVAHRPVVHRHRRRRRRRRPCVFHNRHTGWVNKSKLLILSEYVNKTEKMGGT